MTVLALIPARGNSRRLPGKNLANAGGRPMIAWTIEAALGASSVTHTVVSTDSPEIAEVARRYGADVPFLRPPSLAADDTSSEAVTLHLLEWLETKGCALPDLVVLLQPTSPLRTGADIEAAIAIQRASGAAGVASVCPVTHPPRFLRHIGPQGELSPWLPPRGTSPTATLGGTPAANGRPIYESDGALYQLNGAVYVVDRVSFQAQRTYSPTPVFAYVMPPERSIDVDVAWDLHLVDLILRDRQALYGSLTSHTLSGEVGLLTTPAESGAR